MSILSIPDKIWLSRERLLHPGPVVYCLSKSFLYTDKQALSDIYRQMDRKSHHYSVRFRCKTTTMADSVGHTHTHLCTPLSTLVGGKTANAVIQQSGIKWTLHRDSYVRARMHACIVHAETHAHTQRGGKMIVRQQENWTGNHPSIHKTQQRRRCQSLNYVI